MANFANELAAEIKRLARKELKPDLEAMRKATAAYRSEIAALKRRIADLERAGRVLTKSVSKTIKAVPPEDADTTKLRFRVDGFKTLRQRLDLSAERMGTLLGVSGQSIYLWESGRSVPRNRHLVEIAKLRAMGKREVYAQLEKLEAAS